MPAGAGRPADGDAAQAPLGVEEVEEPEQVVLVRAAPVEEHERVVAGTFADADGQAGGQRKRHGVPPSRGRVGYIVAWTTIRANLVARATARSTLFTMATAPPPPATPARLAEQELRAWRGLLRTYAKLTKALDAELEAAHGLPLNSYEVLMHIADSQGGRMRMHDIASSILLSRSGLTRLVDRLERDGLLFRQSCPSDARGAFACLTPRGHATLHAARATHLAGVRAMFLDRFSPAEQELLGGFWERVGADGAGGSGC